MKPELHSQSNPSSVLEHVAWTFHACVPREHWSTLLLDVVASVVVYWWLVAPWYQHVLVPGEIGRLCADHCSSGLHDSYPMSHTSSDGGGIELHPVDSEIWFTPTYAMATPTQKFKIVFWLIYTPFWEPILISKCAQSFICDIFDPPTQWPAHAKLKKTKKKQFRAPFWKPISVKMKIWLKITSIVRVSTLFVHKKLIYAYANDFHIL